MRSPWINTLTAICVFILGASPLGAQPIKDLYDQATDAFNNKQFSVASRLYQQLIDAFPRFAPAYNGLALSLQGVPGSEEQSIHNFKMAIQYDPRLVSAYENLGRLHYERQEYDLARGYFENALRIDPHGVTAQLGMAWIYLLVDFKPSKALKYFKAIVKKSPAPNTYFGLGLAYFADNQRSKALEMITQLRGMGEESLAAKLESSVRENRWINNEPMGGDKRANVVAGGKAVSDGSPVGLNVRLRGKLSDY